MNFFAKGFEDLHNDDEQLIRQDRSVEVEVDWLPRLDENGKPILTKKGNVSRHYLCNGRLQTGLVNGYLVSLHGCSCRDFGTRQLPCKHMYKLAAKLGVFNKFDERTTTLIADFSTGFADGWAFPARPCNYAALDINSKPRWSQGRIYNFTAGLVFYDDIAGYTEIWRDALQKIEFCLQIDEASASSSYPLVEWIGKQYYRREIPIYGTVKFSVYKPNAERTRLEKVASYSCSQCEFVELLKTGSFCDDDGEFIKLKSSPAADARDYVRWECD